MDLFSIMVVSSTKQDKSNYYVKENELFKILKDVSSEMKNKSDCYVKVIKKNYNNNEKLILKYHLLFLSKLHYKK